MKMIASTQEIHMMQSAQIGFADWKCACDKHTEYRHIPAVNQEWSLLWEIHSGRYCSLHSLVCIQQVKE